MKIDLNNFTFKDHNAPDNFNARGPLPYFIAFPGFFYAVGTLNYWSESYSVLGSELELDISTSTGIWNWTCVILNDFLGYYRPQTLQVPRSSGTENYGTIILASPAHSQMGSILSAIEDVCCELTIQRVKH